MEKYISILDELRTDYEQSQTTWLSKQKEILSRVAVWRWASGSMFSLEPFPVEMNQQRLGNWLDKQEEDGVEYVKIGLDAQDRVISENAISYSSLGHEKYISYEEHHVIVYQSDLKNNLVRLEKAKITNNGTEWSACYSEHSSKVNLYFRDKKRIVRIESLIKSRYYTQTPTYYINYLDSDEVANIRRTDPKSELLPDGQDILVYQKNPYDKGTLFQFLIDETVSAVTEVLSKQSEKVCWIAVILIEGFGRDDWFPPDLAFGLENEQEAGKKLPNLTERLQHHVRLDSAKLSELSRLFIQECEVKKDYSAPSFVLKQTAVKLRQAGNNGIFSATDDFIVIPFDTDNTSVEESLEEIYTQDEMKILLGKWT
ncbi:MAG: hypothetical protein MUD08_02240 [Cytophagales bacterium]|nr:hypothetical protein [Cytophagales bacterium]